MSWLKSLFFWKKPDPRIDPHDWVTRARYSLLANGLSYTIASAEFRIQGDHGHIRVYMLDGSMGHFEAPLTTSPEELIREKICPWMQQS